MKNQGKLDDAIASYRRVLELDPNFAGIHNNLGAAFKDQGKPDEAGAYWRRELELNPNFAEAHNNLGTVLREQGKLDEAIACYRRAWNSSRTLPKPTIIWAMPSRTREN